MTETETGKVYKWDDLPWVSSADGTIKRTGFRGDDVLLTFNRFAPTMQRWEPHHYPYDQIIMTVEGRQMLEINGEAMECAPRTVVRVPASAMHTRWPVGEEPVFSIDIFAPAPDDYLHLVKHQKYYRQPSNARFRELARDGQAAAASKFSGKMMHDTSDVLFKWDDLPRVERWNGFSNQAGFRSDGALVAFNYIGTDKKRLEPHSHPTFDQIIMVLEGEMLLEIEGNVMHMPPGSICQVPKSKMHTGWPVGETPLFNVDVFAPARKDYLSLCDYQKEYKGKI